MKRILSICISLALVMSMPISALAAEAGTKSNAQRAQDLMDTYGFTHYAAEDNDPYGNAKPMNQTAEAQALTAVEDAFALMGKATTKKIYKVYGDLAKTSADGKFQLYLYNFDNVWANGAVGMMDTPGRYHSRLHLHAVPSYQVKIQTVVHETMHAFDNGTGAKSGRWLSSDNEGSNAMEKINGPYQFTASINPNQYNDYRASQNSAEDFAYVATEMIMRGGENPCAISKDTKLYKKYVAAYELMLKHFGEESNVVRRSAAFLGK